VIKSENRLHPRDNPVVERYQAAIADLLLEMAALQSNQSYHVNKQVIDRFKALVGQAEQHSKDLLSQHAAPSKLLFEVRVDGVTLDKADLETLVQTGTIRTNLIAQLERLYTSLNVLASVGASHNSSYFLFR
jgi:hypothetical protein